MKRIYEKAALAVASFGVRRLAATFAISAAGLAGIAVQEGTVHKVYLDPVGIPTVCVGHTGPETTRADVGKVVTEQYCQELLAHDTTIAQKAVGRLVTSPITQEQYDALVDLTFNIGSGALASSTLLKYLNAGACRDAAMEFEKWNKAKGRVLPGLVKRRAWERSIFEPGCP